LRSSSPPVIPLPTSLSSHQASLSPPTLPPLPLVDLGLDPEDEEDGDEPEHVPSAAATNIDTSTPPRLDLNLPTTTLSSGPNSPHVATDTAPPQFRERLDLALDGIGEGALHFEAPISPADAGPSFGRYFEPVASTPLFEWSVPSALDWDGIPARSPGDSQPRQSPPPSPWQQHFRSSNNNPAVAPDTTVADLRRLLGSTYPPPPPSRLFPRPPSLAAPLSVAATTTSGLDAGSLDLEDAYLDLRMPNARAWDSALDRARNQQRERERDRRERERRERERDRERERERQIEREREEEAERERDNPWSLDSIWGSSSGIESFPSARPLRMRRELAEEELTLTLAIQRRRAMERQLQETSDRTDRILDRQRESVEDERPERGQSSMSRAARYLESGLVDPREAPSPPGTRSRPPSEISNPFPNVPWASRRAMRPTEDDVSASRPHAHRSRSGSQSREVGGRWLGRIGRDESATHFDLFDEWLSEHPTPRSVTPAVSSSRSGTHDEREAYDYPRRNEGPGASSSGELWRARAAGQWQPRLALSPQSAAQPTRTAAHARAQSIPSSSLSSLSSATAQPSLHRLRQRLHGPPRVGATTSLVAESAAAIRRREARSELMERLNRNISMDIDSDPESDYDFRDPPNIPRPRTRHPRGRDDDRDSVMDSDDDAPHLSYLLGLRPPTAARSSRFRSQEQNESSHSPPLTLRDSEEPPAASSSSLNSRQPLSIHTRRPIVRLRQHPLGGREITPPASVTASVDRRHVSWEAPSPSRDAGVSTYQYLSALSHGFDSQSLSISDLAHTITSNSSNEALRTPPSPMWGENSESPFSTLFARSPAPPPSASRSNVSGTRTHETSRESSVPSLPPPDLGGDFDRGEDILRSAAGARAGVATNSDLPTSRPIRPLTPPSHNPYTGPFRLTMQRREEGLRRAAGGAPRRVPDPPSIPPLYFGADFDNGATPSQSPTGLESRDSRHRPFALPSSQRPQSQGPVPRSEYASSRFAEAERRLFSYGGPITSSPTEGLAGDPRRFFSSRPTPTSSTSHANRLRDTDEQSPPRRYSATDMHNVLARQARLIGSRLAPDSDMPPSRTSRGETDNTDLSRGAFSSSRAERLISRYHEQAEAEAHFIRPEVEAHRRRRVMGPRVLMATSRFRRRTLGDYMVRTG
ncbi:hypothetical protein B0H14DRAFT_2664109, partial [Mycena olivaceomarginata]